MAGPAAPFSRLGRVQALLDVESALAEALAEGGVIPASSLPAIRSAARVELYDLDRLEQDALTAGNILIPLVQQMTRQVAEAEPAAADHVHVGATSQDVMDTALVLQLHTAVSGLLQSLELAGQAAADLAQRYVDTPIAGRTWLQQATPTTFGAKAAVWLDGIGGARRALAAALDDVLVLQFGGATGTLASLHGAALVVEQALANRLKLRVADIPWHTGRHRLASLACALGVTCGSLGKTGRDIALLSQTEIDEVREPHEAGRGTSSSMPHKRNPVASAIAIAAAVQAPGLVATMLSAMVQEHERSAGGWQAEWETLPALVVLTSRSAEAMASTLSRLVVNPARMRSNLDAAGGVARAEGLMSALTPHLGRRQARALVERVTAEATDTGRQLEAVAVDAEAIRECLTVAQIASSLDVANPRGAAAVFVRRVVEQWQRDQDQERSDG
jgi:3-carboxy-cis,cis-muconate cycloisomerase